MSVTIMSNKKYEEECAEGTKICIMCGQWNTKEKHNCWYCGAREITSMEKAGCIRPSHNLPVSRDDNTYTVDTMVLDNWAEEPERIKSFKATKAYVSEEEEK